MMKFIRSLISFFRPKPFKPSLQKQGIAIVEFYPNSDNHFIVGAGGSGGSEGKTGTVLIGGPGSPNAYTSIPEEVPKRGHTCDAPTHLGSFKEFSTLTDPMAHGDLIIHQASTKLLDSRLSKSSGMAAKLPKKKKLTKKQAVELNARLIVSIIMFAPVYNMTTIELQRASKIRRDRFLSLLKKLVRNGTIVRVGSGRSGDPYRYGLPKSKKDNK